MSASVMLGGRVVPAAARAGSAGPSAAAPHEGHGVERSGRAAAQFGHWPAAAAATALDSLIPVIS